MKTEKRIQFTQIKIIKRVIYAILICYFIYMACKLFQAENRERENAYPEDAVLKLTQKQKNSLEK